MSEKHELYDELIKRGFNSSEINQFLKGLEHGVVFPRYLKDVEIMRKLRMICAEHDYKFSLAQQKIILNGLLSDIDVSIYADPKYKARQMDIIYCGLVHGVDITPYCTKTILNQWTDYLTELRLGLMHGLNEEQMKSLVDICENYNVRVAKEYRYCLEDGIDIDTLSKVDKSSCKDLHMLRKKWS